MSVRDRCQAYRLPTSGYWKQSLGSIMEALKVENHPDEQIFYSAACTLMMNDKPCYWRWLDVAITKLIDDPTARLDPLPDLPDYEDLSSTELIDKYEMNEKNYPQNEILLELKSRYPLLIKSSDILPISDLKETLKNVI